ncbi:rhombotarget lipoprotein [Shewanella sp. OPT22]|nr:rhombotarget lipoprotein [Shewanella sp. OPT22]
MKKGILLFSFAFMLAGCADLIHNSRSKNTVSSSLISFLYPTAEVPPKEIPSIPVLTLPIKVGIAFVPSKRDHINNQEQVTLLNKVKASFEQYEYIDKVEVIPSVYLDAVGGFNTLEQVSRLYDVDVMALVSYDQLRQSYDNPASLLYWSIVGLYVIPGNSNTVQTFVDTAVFDIKSRKMLFRAPGIHKSESISTAVGSKKKMHDESLAGFEAAVTNMIPNLDNELSRFKTRVKEEKVAKVKKRDGYSGGALGGALLVLCFIGFRRFKSLA